MVSVIIPVYNVEKYLKRCVDSICNQTYKELEVLLVDDGSDDSSPEICEEYVKVDERISVIHKKNGGLSDARNIGVQHATGKFVYFCDSDDYIEPNLIEDCVKKMEEDKSDIVIFDFYRVQEGFLTVCSANLPTDNAFSLENNPGLLLTSPSACNKLFRMDFLKKNRISFPVGKLYEDLGTIPKLYPVAQKISYLDTPYYYYEIRSGSIMTTGRYEKSFQDRMDMIHGILDYYKDLNIYERYKDELEYLAFFNGLFLPIREISLRSCDKEECNRYKKAILAEYPKCFQNKYIRTMSKKEKIFVSFIRHEQYWLFPLINKLKKSVMGVK